MLTNTELAILGLLAEEPVHGYQIEQKIAQRGMREWTEIGFSSIYYVMNKLEAAGLLESKLVHTSPQTGTQKADRGPARGPARRVYSITAVGQRALTEAVHERLAQPRPFSGDFDLGLANLPALPSTEARTAVEAHREALRRRATALLEKWSAERAAAQREGHELPDHVDALFDHSLAMLHAEWSWAGTWLSGNLETQHHNKKGKA